MCEFIRSSYLNGTPPLIGGGVSRPERQNFCMETGGSGRPIKKRAISRGEKRKVVRETKDREKPQKKWRRQRANLSKRQNRFENIIFANSMCKSVLIIWVKDICESDWNIIIKQVLIIVLCKWKLKKNNSKLFLNSEEHLSEGKSVVKYFEVKILVFFPFFFEGEECWFWTEEPPFTSLPFSGTKIISFVRGS